MDKTKTLISFLISLAFYFAIFLILKALGIPIKPLLYVTGIVLGFLVKFFFDCMPIIGLRSFTFFYYSKFLFLSEEDLFNHMNLFKNSGLRSGLIWGLSVSIPWMWILPGLLIAFPKLRKSLIWNHKPKKKNVTNNDSKFSFTTEQGILEMDNIFRGVFISGGAGSGKSKSLIEPLIHQAGEKGFTGIVYDYKFPTLAEEVNGSYPDKGKVKKFFVNFTDPEKSHRVNPIHPSILSNSNYARELATTIISNLDPESIKKKDFWSQSSEALLTGTMWYLRQEHPDKCTLPHAVSILLNAPNGKQLVETLKANDQVAGIISGIESALESEKTSASIFSTIRTQLSSLYTPEIFWVLGNLDGDFRLDINNPSDKKIVVLGNNPSLSNTFSPLISLILTSALKQMNQQGKSSSMILLDEAPTLFIPKFDEIPATARSNKLATVYCAQDVSQMEDRYGATKSETIISNLGNQFYGRTTNIKTAERVSKMFGRYDKSFESRSHSINFKEGGNTSRSQAVQQRERVEAQEIMRLCPGEFYGVLAEGSPIEFGSCFSASKSKIKSLPTIYDSVSQSELNQNFKGIIEDAKSVLFQKDLSDELLRMDFSNFSQT